MNRKKQEIVYSAKDLYRDNDGIENYEKSRFSGALGQYRYSREQKAVKKLLDLLPNDISVADIPCGNGRWWDAITSKANQVIAVDHSPIMLKYARQRAAVHNASIEVHEGDAEDLFLDTGSVDYVFSHALTKHLPVPVQYRVLSEFSRIARRGVICSFGIFSHITYEIWRRRGLSESYPVFPEELQWMATAAGLEIVTKRKCTTPIGTEYTVLFHKDNYEDV